MPLLAAGLAASIQAQMGAPTNPQPILILSDTIVTELQENGVATIGSPTGNRISNLDGERMADYMANELELEATPQTLVDFFTAIAAHIMTSGTVTYTDTPIYSVGGLIVGLVSSLMANEISVALKQTFVSAQLTQFCTAVTTYIMTNATVTATKIL
jgi:hypothetical protein